MLSICQICLSTDRTLQALGEPISNWHDELCDFAIEDYTLYCSECTYMLNKFHNFKEKCLLANKILQKWKNQDPKFRTEPSQLKNKMPPSSLGISRSKNHRIYFYEEQDVMDNQNDSINGNLTCPKNNFAVNFGLVIDTLIPTQILNSDTFMHNVDASTSNEKFIKDMSSELQGNANVSELTKNCELKVEPINDNESKEYEVKIENNVQVKNEIASDHNDSNSDVSVTESLLNNDSDSSDDEILFNKRKRPVKTECDTKKPKKKTEMKEDDLPLKKLKKEVKKDDSEKKKVKKRGPYKKQNLESIKYNLMCKFGNAEIKDEDGNILDKDSIIESLDKMHKLTLGKVERQCLGPKPFTPEAIQVLSQIQKRYGNQFSSVFTTVHLSTTEQVLEEFKKRQEHESYAHSDHKCTLCYRGFKHKTQLEYHINEYHNSEYRPHVCQICQMRFKDAQGLRRHVRSHRIAYKCKLCPLVTNYSNVMETHYNQHNGVKHTCELCKAELNSKTSLYAHMNSMHPSKDIFCPLCARTFNSEYGLTQHKLRKHPNEEISEGPASARCESCDITFISDAVYETHLTKSHADKYPTLFKRRKITGKRKPPKLICRVCKKVEHSMGRLKLHFTTEHPNTNTDTVSMCLQTLYNHLCHVCGKGFKNIGDLNEHKHLHTGAKPFACDKCPKTFHRKTNLRVHLERHFPPTRECPHCGKKFPSAANLNNHIKTHIGLRQHSCDLCEKSFLDRGALNAHVRGVHLRIRRARNTNKEQGE